MAFLGNDRVRGYWVTPIAIGVVILLTSCFGSAPLILRVPSVALESVRSIGETKAESSFESSWGNGTQIYNLLVIDVGTEGKQEALDRAANLLGERSWVTVAENRPTIISMNSSKWKGVEVVLRPFNAAYLEDYPEVLRQLEKVPVEERSLVYIEVSKVP
ncbi:hypothetical protein ACQEUU_34075 [Nonomuraea sp. CA-218870]|uniref:LytR/CpsA/Psr regulator C-terminal domain-containing protein n=1 Tax=Nonomuraea corallina TaxID=2989783 RepID=A0ABT4SD30_9ACTN|nr:hypothetical protein [Nonomuraea corallina]MDA0635114.1 hypothetical protein [Nonomuraea corallina]